MFGNFTLYLAGDLITNDNKSTKVFGRLSATSLIDSNFFLFMKVAWCDVKKSDACSSGFASPLFTFRVPRERLHRGTEVGKGTAFDFKHFNQVKCHLVIYV